MIKLESEQQFEELKKGYTVFEFTAGWCPDCKVIEPDLPKLEKKYSQLQFVSVDRDQFIDICVQNDSYIGKERKSIDQIDQFLSQHI
ncbi:MAG: thioredoxin family protein [Staphylococcus epidermidis]|nr:thioredoxin family protein [Staphylococcus epidermidis]